MKSPITSPVHAGLLACGIGALAILPSFLGNYGNYLLALFLVNSVMAMGLNLTLGYAGQVSLAQAAFLGIGAYASALLMQAGFNFFVGFAISAAICFALGVVLGFPALRVQHHFLAFVTLAFNALAWLFMRNEEWLTNGVYGLSGFGRPVVLGLSTDDPAAFTRFVLVLTCILAFALWWLLRSSWGRAFQALRENALRARSLGVNIRSYTLLAFAIGSAYAGMAGALYAPLVEYVDPAPFTVQTSLMVLLMVMIGGSGRFFGPFLGALLVVVLPEFLQFAERFYLMFYALLVMLLMAFCPTGIIGLFEKFQSRRDGRQAVER